MRLPNLVKPFRVTDGKHFRLKDIDPADTRGLHLDKDDAQSLLDKGIARLRALQEMLYAQDRWAVLLIIQGMDAAGKDSVIKHVMSGLNPQACEVHAFKQPSNEELNHDYLWRTTRRLPERGRIGIFNRSYYEEVLIVRVHPELLGNERIPSQLVGKHVWRERFEDINVLERYLTRNGVAICKFFLDVSKVEQKRRFLDRLNDPNKAWKFEPHDVAERQHWKDYMRAYEDMIRHTSTDYAPWHVVPADHKWFTWLTVAEIVIDSLERLDLAYPTLDTREREALQAARLALETE